MKKGETKEYIFKVSNYKKREVNEKELDYEIVITPSSKLQSNYTRVNQLKI